MDNMDSARAIDVIKQALRCEVEEQAEVFTFVLERYGNRRVDIAKTILANLVTELNQKNVTQSLWLNNENSLEILVREESRIPVRSFRDDDFDVRDDDNGVSYRICRGSDCYILFFLNLIAEHPDFRYFLRRGRGPTIYFERRLDERGDALTIFDVVRISQLRMFTISTQCDTATSLAKMARFSDAFLFQLAFNTDVSLVPQRELDALYQSSRINQMRRSRPEEIDPPRRSYNVDLIHHYLLAVSTDNPVVEYLSYYHVLEHFYEAVFNDDLIATIQTKLTQPEFSYRRKRDIKGLISSIQQSLKIKNDTISFSELNALQLTLQKYVDLAALQAELDSYDSSLLEYYRDNKVAFCNGSVVDLISSDTDDVIKKLAKRIYSTRNALVHSKDGDKSKYTPFVDDRQLAKELPLLRFIAERTIIQESTLVE